MIGPGRGLIHKVEICHLYTNRANVVFSKNYTGVDCWDAWHLAPSQLWRCVSSDLQSLSPSTPHRAGSCAPGSSQHQILCQSPPRMWCSVIVWYAVLRWRCREPGGCCCPHGPWAGHVPTVEQVTTLQRVTGECCPYLGDYCAKVDMIITGRGSKICSNCTARCGTAVG